MSLVANSTGLARAADCDPGSRSVYCLHTKRREEFSQIFQNIRRRTLFYLGLIHPTWNVCSIAAVRRYELFIKFRLLVINFAQVLTVLTVLTKPTRSTQFIHINWNVYFVWLEEFFSWFFVPPKKSPRGAGRSKCACLFHTLFHAALVRFQKAWASVDHRPEGYHKW